MGLIQGDEVLLVAVFAEADQQNTVGFSGHDGSSLAYRDLHVVACPAGDSITALRMIAKRGLSG